MFLLSGKLLIYLHQKKDPFRVSVYLMAPLKSEVEKKNTPKELKLRCVEALSGKAFLSFRGNLKQLLCSNA